MRKNIYQKQQETQDRSRQSREEYTQLIIDEDSIYEIDLECMKCRDKKRSERA